MFRALRLRQEPVKVAPDPEPITLEEWMGDANYPISIRAINGLGLDAKQRIYRSLVPPALLVRLDINPLTWKGSENALTLKADPEQGLVNLSVKNPDNPRDEYVVIELADNSYNGIDLNLIILNDPSAERFSTDYDAQGNATQWGTVTRNFAEEERAKRAGLAPAQVRAGLNASREVLHQLDVFLAVLTRQAVSLEPLTYASAWIFEKRGFAYVRGHKLMDDINREFQPGGKLHAMLDGSTPFRQPDQWATVRGRAWAIHDGILEAIGEQWRDLRMIKQVGRHAGVETFPGAVY